MVLQISRFRNKTDNRPTAETIDWPTLAQMLTTFERRRSKDGPLWSPASYPPNALRRNANVESISCLALDFDEGHDWKDLEDHWRSLGLSFALHTTWRHSLESPRWRAVFPLDLPCPAADWPRLCQSATLWLGHGIAETHTDPARMFYLPSARDAAPVYSVTHDGRPLCLHDVPAEFEDGISHVSEGDVRPGDAFEGTVTWSEILEPRGWRVHSHQGTMTLWTRPGKAVADGASARTGVGTRGDRFYCWSTSAAPVPAGQLLTKFGLYAALEHGGDAAAAASALRKKGYGGKTVQRGRRITPKESEEAQKRSVEVNRVDPAQVVAEAYTALLERNDPPVVFVRNDHLSHVVNGTERPKLRLTGKDWLNHRLTECALFESTSSKRGAVPVAPPAYVAPQLLQLGEYPGLPVIEGVAHSPYLTDDGRIVNERGYDASSRMYLTEGHDWPDWEGDGAEAVEWLWKEVFVDFPFVGGRDGANFANTLAAVLTPFVRPAVRGSVPLVVFDAPSASTGKTWLAKAALVAGCGDIGVRVPPVREEEWQKLLTSMVACGVPALLLDNVTGTLASPTLLAALTGGRNVDRLLGTNEVTDDRIATFFVATANNMRLATDFVSRSLYVRLDSGLERPEKRSKFKRPDLLYWAIEHRALIGSAVLGMVRHWILCGRPMGSPPSCRFDSWARIVGGILESCGVTTLLENAEQLEADQGDEDALFAGVLEALYDVTDGRPFVLGDVWDALGQSQSFLEWSAGFTVAKDPKRAVGNALNARRDRPFGGWRLVRERKSNRGAVLRVTRQHGRVSAMASGDTLLCSSAEEVGNQVQTVIPETPYTLSGVNARGISEAQTDTLYNEPQNGIRGVSGVISQVHDCHERVTPGTEVSLEEVW